MALKTHKARLESENKIICSEAIEGVDTENADVILTEVDKEKLDLLETAKSQFYHCYGNRTKKEDLNRHDDEAFEGYYIQMTEDWNFRIEFVNPKLQFLNLLKERFSDEEWAEVEHNEIKNSIVVVVEKNINFMEKDL